jgi:hypothetical protein
VSLWTSGTLGQRGGKYPHFYVINYSIFIYIKKARFITEQEKGGHTKKSALAQMEFLGANFSPTFSHCNEMALWRLRDMVAQGWQSNKCLGETSGVTSGSEDGLGSPFFCLLGAGTCCPVARGLSMHVF